MKKEKEVLKIVIKGNFFDLIASGKKVIEYREQTQFWISRLYDKEGSKRHYDLIEFINGYNTNARRMITKYEGFSKRSGQFWIKVGKIVKK